jgi:predicted nucleic acid-binding protein
MSIIVDASVALAWCLPDEPNPLAEKALDRLADEDGLVPALFWFEVRNVLLTAERRSRIEAAHADEAMSWLREMPFTADPGDDDVRVLALARKHGLTAYDAAYLALALAKQAPLATLDGALAHAAGKEGVAVVGG